MSATTVDIAPDARRPRIPRGHPPGNGLVTALPPHSRSARTPSATHEFIGACQHTHSQGGPVSASREMGAESRAGSWGESETGAHRPTHLCSVSIAGGRPGRPSPCFLLPLPSRSSPRKVPVRHAHTCAQRAPITLRVTAGVPGASDRWLRAAGRHGEARSRHAHRSGKRR